MLLLEPGVLEFYCPSDHKIQFREVLLNEAKRTQDALRQALDYWEAQVDELTRETDAFRSSIDLGRRALWVRRYRVAVERVSTLRRALKKYG